jgi:hypothetical protein
VIDGACSTYEERRGTYRILVGKSERERERDHLEYVSKDGRIIVK